MEFVHEEERGELKIKIAADMDSQTPNDWGDENLFILGFDSRDWQNWASEQSLSYGELAKFQGYFETLAKKFDLTDEFIENGIIGASEKNTCKHEDRISYIDLLQVDGQPLYTVVCEDCREYGTIELVEGDNHFGMTFAQIEALKKAAE